MRRWSFVAKVMMSTLVMSRTKPQKRCFDASQSVEQIYKVFSNKVQSYKCSQNPLLCINGKIWCDEDLEQIPMLMLFWKKNIKKKIELLHSSKPCHYCSSCRFVVAQSKDKQTKKTVKSSYLEFRKTRFETKEGKQISKWPQNMIIMDYYLLTTGKFHMFYLGWIINFHNKNIAA